MQPTDTTPDPWRYPSDGFWDRYVASLRATHVKPTAVRWYVIRAKHYLQAMSPKRLAEHTPQDVTDYLTPPTLVSPPRQPCDEAVASIDAAERFLEAVQEYLTKSGYLPHA